MYVHGLLKKSDEDISKIIIDEFISYIMSGVFVLSEDKIAFTKRYNENEVKAYKNFFNENISYIRVHERNGKGKVFVIHILVNKNKEGIALMFNKSLREFCAIMRYEPISGQQEYAIKRVITDLGQCLNILMNIKDVDQKNNFAHH